MGNQNIVINSFKKSNPYIGKVIRNIQLTPDAGKGKRPKKEGMAIINRIIIEIDHESFPFTIGQSAGIIPPGEDPEKVAKGAENTGYAIRLYSISSPTLGMDKSGKSIEFIIKRDNSYDAEGNITQSGVCSNYICDAKPGDSVQMTGPNGKTFLLPDSDYDGDIFFCATGTGIAPFFGMSYELLEQRNIKFIGNIHMLYGAAYSDEIVLRTELEELAKQYKNFHFHPVISREEKNKFDGGRNYITHKLRELSSDLKKAMESNGRLYICGGPKGMETGIFEEIKKAILFEGEIKEMEEKLKTEKKLFVETY